MSEKQTSFDLNKLQLLSELDRGSYGVVSDAIYNNIPLVVKSSLLKDNNEQLIHEYRILKRLQSNKFCGIPKVGYRFTYKDKESFLMEKLDTDLLKLVNKIREKKFSLKTTLMIALQVLNRLKSIHGQGVIHNDIKPGNMMIGAKEPNTIYLIDYGLATTYLNGSAHIQETQTNDFHGTWMYKSINS